MIKEVVKFVPNPVIGSSSTELHNASYYGNETLVKELIENGENCSVVDDNGCIPLHYSSMNNHVLIMNLLIKCAAKSYIDAQDNLKKTPAHYATNVHNTGALNALIDAGARLDIQDYQGRLPIHIAIIKKDLDKVSALFKAKAGGRYFGIDIKDSSNRTVLMHAIHTLPNPLVKEILNHGPDISTLDENERNWLHVTCINNPHNSDSFALSIKTVINMGVSASVTDRWGNLPLHYLMEHNELLTMPALADAILGATADINKQNHDGQTPLQMLVTHKCIGKEYVSLIEELLRRGANVTLIDNKGQTPLHALVSSCGSGSKVVSATVIFEKLQEAGANLALQNIRNETVLHIATKTPQSEWVNKIISINSHGPDFDLCSIQDNNGNTPVHLALQACHTPLKRAELLCKNTITALIPCIKNGTVVNKHGHTYMGYLLKMENECFSAADSALAKAVHGGGADINTVDGRNKTLLHCAAECTDYQMIRRLLAFGSRNDIRDSRGDTPLDIVLRQVIVKQEYMHALPALLFFPAIEQSPELKSQNAYAILTKALWYSDFHTALSMVDQYINLPDATDTDLLHKALDKILDRALSDKNLEVAQNLLEKYRDTDPLHKAADRTLDRALNDKNLEVAQNLLEKYKDTDPLHKAADRTLDRALSDKNLEVAQNLLEKYRDTDPLHKAADRTLDRALNDKNLEVAQNLLEKYKDTDPLHKAADRTLDRALSDKNLEVAQNLLEKYRDTDPLHKAADRTLDRALNDKNLEVAQNLLEKYKDTDPLHKAVDSTLDRALNDKNLEVAQNLLEKYKDTDPLHKALDKILDRALSDKNLEVAQNLLEKYKDTDPLHKALDKILDRALRDKNLEVAQNLLEKYKDPDALHKAMDKVLDRVLNDKNFDVAQKLIGKYTPKLDIDKINAQDFDTGNTLLHKAVNAGSCEVIRILVLNGVNTEITNLKGNAPRDMTRDPSVMNCLNSARMDADRGSDNHAHHALYTAVLKGDPKLVEEALSSPFAKCAQPGALYNVFHVNAMQGSVEVFDILQKNCGAVKQREELLSATDGGGINQQDMALLFRNKALADKAAQSSKITGSIMQHALSGVVCSTLDTLPAEGRVALGLVVIDKVSPSIKCTNIGYAAAIAVYVVATISTFIFDCNKVKEYNAITGSGSLKAFRKHQIEAESDKSSTEERKVFAVLGQKECPCHYAPAGLNIRFIDSVPTRVTICEYDKDWIGPCKPDTQHLHATLPGQTNNEHHQDGDL